MSERGMFSDVITPRDGCGHVAFADFNRARQIMVRRQRRRDGRRIRAAGAVSRNTFDKRRAQQPFRPAIKKNVHRLAPPAQVASAFAATASMHPGSCG